LKQRQIEKKKILKKIEKSFYGKKCDLWIKNSQGNKIYLKPTRNHEYYVVGKGYIRADNLEPGDKLIEYTGEFKSQYATRCKYPNCKKIVYSDLDKHPYMTAHYRKKHGHKIKIHACPVCKEEIKGSIKWHNFWHHGNKIEQIELIQKRDESHKKYFKTQKGILDRKNLSKRMITNNPDHNKKYKEKAAISWKKTFYSKSVEEQLKIIKRFQLAPTHKKKPNNVEKSIIDMGISNLKFTGDGKYYVTLQIEGKKFHKNPDFIYVPEKCGVCKNFDLCNGIQKNNNSCEKWEISPSFRTNKVVEIMDFEYWHTKKEAEEIKKAYQEHGIKCLIIDATFPPYKKRSEIEAFINNHYATVISSKICKKKDHKNNKVYTLKVEDNHNYFVLATNSKHQFGDKNIPITPILVSNCQDLSKIQYEIVTLINDPQKTKTLFLVGDINQSIFGWRSAKPENMDDFIEKYKPSVQFLTFNYRSSPEIVSHANQYLQFGKPMVSKIAYKGIVSMTQFSSQEEEASKISEALQRIGNYPESVIIYRANSRSILFEKALAMRRIPYKVVGDIPFYKRRVSKDLLSYCKAAVNRQDMESLIRSVNTPKRGFGEAKQERLLNNGWSYLQAMAEAMPPIQAFIELLESIKRKRPLQAVEEVIFKTGYRDTLKTDGDKQMLTSFLNITTGFNSIEELVLTSSFLEEDSGHGVKLMTAHASKGLEFDNVFVVGVEKDLWPHILSEDVDEERRLYYVAITRSKRFLNISYSKTKLYRNIQIPVLPSPLFEESLKSMAKNNV
jgi:superfamily I DNA/RNA helicase